MTSSPPSVGGAIWGSRVRNGYGVHGATLKHIYPQYAEACTEGGADAATDPYGRSGLIFAESVCPGEPSAMRAYDAETFSRSSQYYQTGLRAPASDDGFSNAHPYAKFGVPFGVSPPVVMGPPQNDEEFEDYVTAAAVQSIEGPVFYQPPQAVLQPRPGPFEYSVPSQPIRIASYASQPAFSSLGQSNPTFGYGTDLSD